MSADEFLEILTDSRVRDVLAEIFSAEISNALDTRLATFSSTLDTITADTKKLHQRCDKLVEENKTLTLENKSLRKELS